ncbi:hypothetical protein G3576_21785 [Roseomonas stagni]|uniref:Lipoprotein n=1 Tax=Falsiroseomonas algicola TaxID=2716930 RepID=A0A6M1LQI7_9PROT|nr:hypothetical protein [Falsiroseomonas algicola]NGM22660.1 hypothetical protein [Falsiroseomonas algicola]
MRRTKALRLVLLGGGVTSLLAACGDDEARAAECARARAEQRPNAEQICQQSRSRSSHYGGSWFSGRTSSASGAATAASQGGSSARGGFGGSTSSSSS